MLLAEKLERIKRAHPNISSHGQLYRTKVETKRRFSRVTLWALFVSNENTHLLRDHVFEKSNLMTPAEWEAWFKASLRDIHRNAVLPGIAVRTNKQWSVQRIIGWVGDAKYSADSAAVGRARHTTKAKRRTRG